MNKKQENPRERFKRLAEKRTNELLYKLKILGNCSNKQLYSYEKHEIEKIFSTIEKKVKDIKGQFLRNLKQNSQEFKL